MPQKKEVMEFKIQLSYNDGKTWVDPNYRSPEGSFELTKELCDFLRKKNPRAKYRIVGREVMPWCEIKED